MALDDNQRPAAGLFRPQNIVLSPWTAASRAPVPESAATAHAPTPDFTPDELKSIAALPPQLQTGIADLLTRGIDRDTILTTVRSTLDAHARAQAAQPIVIDSPAQSPTPAQPQLANPFGLSADLLAGMPRYAVADMGATTAAHSHEGGFKPHHAPAAPAPENGRGGRA